MCIPMLTGLLSSVLLALHGAHDTCYIASYTRIKLRAHPVSRILFINVLTSYLVVVFVICSQWRLQTFTVPEPGDQGAECGLRGFLTLGQFWKCFMQIIAFLATYPSFVRRTLCIAVPYRIVRSDS